MQVENDDSITISFEFADGIVLTESIPITWNMGVIQFSKNTFLTSDSVQIRVIDLDMNLNPEAIDTIPVEVFSDSDNSGIKVVATETFERSGDFIANISLSTNTSSGNRLHVLPGDNIFAKYDDYTLPKPFSKSDETSIETSATVDYSIPSIDRIHASTISFSDGFGNPLDSLVSETQMQIVGTIENHLTYEQDFVYFFQIKNSENSVISLSWIKGKLSPNQVLDISQSWIPEKSDNYILESYVWNSLNESIPLSPPLITSIIID